MKSADLVTNSSIWFAKKLRISEFIVGFVLLGLLTTLPEISVAANAIRSHVPELSVGNLVGASFVLITLVIGLNVIIRNGLPFRGRYNSSEVQLTLFIIALPAIIMLDSNLTRVEGILLILAYVFLALHLRELFHRKSVRTRSFLQEITDNLNKKLAFSALHILVGVIGLFLSSTIIVESALKIAEGLQVDASVIGMLVLSIGTNLPELTILLRAKTATAEKFAIGNFLGSAVINTAVIGIIALISPYELPNFAQELPLLLFLIGSAVIFALLERSTSQLTRWQGLVLVFLAIAMFLFQITTIFFN